MVDALVDRANKDVVAGVDRERRVFPELVAEGGGGNLAFFQRRAVADVAGRFRRVLGEAEPLPSSFEEAATIELAPLTSLASFCVTDVYPLEGSALEKGLYSTWFSYRKSPERKEAFVLSKDCGVFLLVGYAKNSPLVGQIVPSELFDAEGASGDEEDDEMDFAMM